MQKPLSEPQCWICKGTIDVKKVETYGDLCAPCREFYLNHPSQVEHLNRRMMECKKQAQG
jgi:hypothetical protein